MTFYVYGATTRDYLPDRHTDPALDDWYDDATEEYCFILYYNRKLTGQEVKERKLVLLKTFEGCDPEDG